jgi:hypothetical protein
MSGIDSIIDASRKPFLDVATDISGSLVYLDAGAAEVAQLSLGPAFLLGEQLLNSTQSVHTSATLSAQFVQAAAQLHAYACT